MFLSFTFCTKIEETDLLKLIRVVPYVVCENLNSFLKLPVCSLPINLFVFVSLSVGPFGFFYGRWVKARKRRLTNHPLTWLFFRRWAYVSDSVQRVLSSGLRLVRCLRQHLSTIMTSEFGGKKSESWYFSENTGTCPQTWVRRMMSYRHGRACHQL